jgi:hypothetical protein
MSTTCPSRHTHSASGWVTGIPMRLGSPLSMQKSWHVWSPTVGGCARVARRCTRSCRRRSVISRNGAASSVAWRSFLTGPASTPVADPVGADPGVLSTRPIELVARSVAACRRVPGVPAGGAPPAVAGTDLSSGTCDQPICWATSMFRPPICAPRRNSAGRSSPAFSIQTEPSHRRGTSSSRRRRRNWCRAFRSWCTASDIGALS